VPRTAFSTARALVVGDTGYTGRAVVGALRANGVHTTAHLRPSASDASLWRERFASQGASVDESPWEPAAIAAMVAATRPTVIIACLGTTRRRAAREGLDDPYERVDSGLTRQVLDAAVSAGHSPRFVYLSCIGANPASSSKYVAVRGRSEKELAASGLPYLIVRPALISGTDRAEHRPSERVLAIATDALLSGVAALGGKRVRDKYATLTGTQLAEGMVALALHSSDAKVVADVADIRAALSERV
jgi:uncharacterized protein YbjT (DUF2867 family)